MFQTISQRLAARSASRAVGLPRATSAPLAAVAIFLLALAPRALALGRFVTIDEAYHWFERARLFLGAVRAGDWAATNLIGHPGVTTMWLGALGVAAHQTLAAWGMAAWPDPELLRFMLRLPVAVVTSLCIALAYLLLQRLLPLRVALLAALLWAGDPFLVAHSQLLHVDALLTSFITLTLLAALLAFGLDGIRESVHWPWLVASAIAGGLALLTKSPAIILLPLVGLISIAGWWSQGNDRTGFVPFVALPMLLWCGVVAAVWVALWPAAWLDPLGAISSVVHQAEADGGSPHGWGNFFMGQAIADPGPLFYPFAVALRLTPWTLAGLAAAMVGAIVALRGSPRHMNWPLTLLAIFVALFAAMMTIAAKKFDRYTLPIFPALDIIAAAGLIRILDLRLTQSKIKHLKSTIFFLLATLGLAVNLAWYHPYELAYYNPVLGGGPVAARSIPVGWGEGLEQAGAFITAQPDGAERPVATWYRPALKPYISAPLVPLGDVLQPGRVGYAVLYIDQVQRGDDAAATDLLQSQLSPIYTVRIHGIDYAEVYQVPQPAGQPFAADFGSALHLRGYDLDASKAPSGSLSLIVHWQARAAIPADYMLFIHVLDSNGARVGGVDVPPGGAREPTSAWRPGSYLSAALQIPIQPNLPSGTYWIAIGVYEPRSGARLDVHAPPQPGTPSDGPNALVLEPVVLR